jgi:hypothetical protein
MELYIVYPVAEVLEFGSKCSGWMKQNFKKGLPRRRLLLRDGCNFGGRLKLETMRRDVVTGLAALSAGTLNSRALPPLRASPQSASIDSKKPLEQYFETWAAQKASPGSTIMHSRRPATCPNGLRPSGTDRFEHVRAGKYYLTPGGKLL